MNIYGASGHSKVIIDIIISKDLKIDEIYDDNKNIKNILNRSVSHELTLTFLEKGTILAIGNNFIRKTVASKFKGVINPSIAHASSWVSPTVNMGKGTVVMANATVNSDTIVGEHCIINTGSTVEHDCKLGDFVHISPNAALAGGVEVGEGTQIGIGAVVIQGIKIGDWAIIGAGAVIINDIPDHATAVGNPGRIIKGKN